MVSTLSVKNFGPIKDISIQLKNVNVFIGPQASGKSAIAKLFTIFKAPRKFFYKKSIHADGCLIFDNENAATELDEVLEEYNIKSYLQDNTFIKFESELHDFTYDCGSISYTPKLYNKIAALTAMSRDFESNKNTIADEVQLLSDQFVNLKLAVGEILKIKNIPLRTPDLKPVFEKENCFQMLELLRNQENVLSTNAALYIPAERIFSNIIKKSSLNLMMNKVPIPRHILSFGAELEKMQVNEVDLNFIQKGLVYQLVNGEDKISTHEGYSINLTEASSGIQSVVPVLLSILTSAGKWQHQSIVIEEPELNLFPTAQYQLIQLFESKRTEVYWEDLGSIHTYTTHSPYVLSAINNLLYADKARLIMSVHLSRKGVEPEEIDKIVDEKVGSIIGPKINPDYFTAYQIVNGGAQSIFNEETELIDENYIDKVSDEMNDDFAKLMDIVSEYQ